MTSETTNIKMQINQIYAQHLEQKCRALFLYTDLTRDVDDAKTLTLLQSMVKYNYAQIWGIVTNSYVANHRARVLEQMQRHFGQQLTIGAGSCYPLGQENERPLLLDYFKTHQINDESYEGLNMKALNLQGYQFFSEPIQMLHQSLYWASGQDRKLDIVCLSPLTDLAQYVIKNKNMLLMHGGSLTIQGQGMIVEIDGKKRMVPDPAAYNLSEDFTAAKIIFDELQDFMPINLLGKWAAYEIKFFKEEFSEFGRMTNPVGAYLETAAHKGLECFHRRRKKVCEMLYCAGKEVETENLIENCTHLSNAYDETALLALMAPKLFTPDIFEIPGKICSRDPESGVALISDSPIPIQHRLIGMEKDKSCVNDPAIVKSIIKAGILDTLSVPSPVPETEETPSESKIQFRELTMDH